MSDNLLEDPLVWSTKVVGNCSMETGTGKVVEAVDAVVWSSNRGIEKNGVGDGVEYNGCKPRTFVVDEAFVLAAL